MILWVEFAIVLLVSAMTVVGIIEYYKLGMAIKKRFFKSKKRAAND
jgi:hypothetical protein